MQIDGEAALRCWAVTVDVAGVDYRIAPRPAADWIAALATHEWTEIVPGWLDDPRPLDDAFIDGLIAYDDLCHAARAAVAAAAGTTWWAARRLLGAGLAEPAVMGRLALGGVDLTRAPLGAVVAAMYHLYTREATAMMKARLDAELDKPPPEVTAAQRFDTQAMAQQFERFYAARGGGARAGAR